MGNNTTIEMLVRTIKRQKAFICMLIICIPIIVVFTLKHHFDSNPVENSKFKMLDPLREFVPAESYITNVQDLRDYLNDLGNKYPDSISIYYENINSGSNISINRDLKLFPASLSKLIQAILIVKKIENKQLSWNTELKALPEDISSDSGTLYQSIGDRTVTVEKLIEELLVNSDNTAQNIFRRQLTADDYILFQYETGLQDLYNEEGFISAKEYTRSLRVLYTSSYLEPENSQKVLEYMSGATFKDYLSQGIPSDVTFAHKFGENIEHNIFADSGIVYIPGKPYMLTVIIKGKDSTEETTKWAKQLMKEISERAYSVSK